MSFEKELLIRSENKCELCGATEELSSFAVPNSHEDSADTHVWLCGICSDQINNPETVDPNRWRCLNDSMWNSTPAVQVLAWRMLNQLKGEGWPQDLLDMMYLEDATKAWAEAGISSADAVVHRDSNGVVLSAGDNVNLIKDLVVKGGGFTAKRGTAVRGIRLVADNAEHIEGKVNGQTIVILTQYTKKM